jgi:sulfatase modifying factor 1
VAIAASTGPASSSEMVLLPGGRFLIGSNDPSVYPADGEGPVREVSVESFWVDRFAVSNEDFSEFTQCDWVRTKEAV